jgi:hypothetical protein
MGLLNAVYEFDDAERPCTELERKLNELFPDQLLKEGTVEPAPTDDQSVPSHQQRGFTLLLRSTQVTIRAKNDSQRWARSLELTISLDGKKLCVTSNWPELFRTACEELQGLGGSLYKA